MTATGHASAAEFVAQVLRLQPRAAAFDCDGTLWAADSGESFFYWEIEQGLIPPEVAPWALPRYADYKQGRLSEEQNCIDSIVIHKGLAVETIEHAAARFVQQHVLPGVFPEMRELLARLDGGGCDVWVVSSTNEWVVEAAVAALGVEKGRVIATAVRVEDGRATDVLVRVPTGPAKAEALQREFAVIPDAAFGNSIHDLEMLTLARHAFAVNPTPGLRQAAFERGWTVYDPERS